MSNDKSKTEGAIVVPAYETPRQQTPRDVIRRNINDAADAGSREGVTSDALAVVLVGLTTVIAAITNPKNDTTAKQAAAIPADFTALSSSVLDAIKAGTLRFPFQAKPGGAAAAVSSLTQVSNAVTDAYAAGLKEAAALAPVQAPAPAPAKA